MRTYRLIALLLVVSGLCVYVEAKDDTEIVRHAVGRSTLNQPGTKPFHLKAELAPSREQDRGSGRTGEVEIWWMSPTQWRREVRSPEFHQIAIVNGSREWQKNEGDYFPEWLRVIATELIEPVPYLDRVLKEVQGADVKRMMGSTYYSWTMTSTDGTVQSGVGASLAINDSTGLLFYGGSLGWGGLFKDYKNFHGRMVAHTVSEGAPEVTAKVITLEDLGAVPPELFDADAKDGDAQPLRTVLLEESSLRKNLVPMEPVAWPTLQDGPLEGAVGTIIVVDRQGKVREVSSIVATNPGVTGAAGKAVASMQFKPFLDGGVPVQVVARVTLPFKTVRPKGTESFESAQTYFERGRHACFPAAGAGTPYVLRATFKLRTTSGNVEECQYVDTWTAASEWRREASVSKSRFVRTQHGEKRYMLSEGPDANLLKMVLRFLEPIPAIDTFTESDWHMKRDTVDGIKTVRVAVGTEKPDGSLDNARGYWFDDSGKLVKSYTGGIETDWSEFAEFSGVQIARKLRVLKGNDLVMLITVTDVAPAGTVPAETFELRKHEWTRAFTDEVR